jgi:hypothetical protein
MPSSFLRPSDRGQLLKRSGRRARLPADRQVTSWHLSLVRRKAMIRWKSGAKRTCRDPRLVCKQV